jgi:hypothetical protein
MKRGFIQLLQSDSTVSALVAADQVYDTVLGRGFVLPAGALHVYGLGQDYDYDAPVGVTERQIQIDIYGRNPTEAAAITDAIRALLIDYKNATLPDGTFVQACFLERDEDLPYQTAIGKTDVSFRPMLGFRVVVQRV